MAEVNKRGSSRRKGDEYQDLTALRIALENYIARKPFKMFLEYEKADSLDDIVLFQETHIRAYQVKYAVNPLDLYELKDLTDPQSRVYLKKLSDSWYTIRESNPDNRLTACLWSNRGLDSALLVLVKPDGTFRPEVIEDSRRKKAKRLRNELASVSGLDEETFRQFLTDFQFCVRQPTLLELKQFIQSVLLDRELGISDISIFHDLKEAVEDTAIFSRDPITNESIDRLLERLQSKLLIPQVFPVNQDHFVEHKALTRQLDDLLPQIDGGYLIVTGLPGSGKSTSLTTYFRGLDRATYEVFSYYCFVDINDNAQKMRVRAESLRENLLNEFNRRYPDVLSRRYDYSEPNFLVSLKTLAKHYVEKGRKFVIFLDGLDHAERLEPEVRETLISALPPDLPEGVAIVVGTQELRKWPRFLKRARECPENHIQMPLFSASDTQDYLENKRGITGLSDAELVEIHRMCEGLPLYLQYAAEVILSSDTITGAIASLVPAEGGDILQYYELLWEEFEHFGMGSARHLCAAMACLRFSVHREELFTIQALLNRPEFEDAFKCMSHLLRNSDNRLGVFHNSFREFVIGQLAKGWIREIKESIVDFLKAIEDSPRWFGYVFEYCYETTDYDYILSNVNAEFVDRALLRFRPSVEIEDAFHWAIESAHKQQDIVQLSRLGPLKARTSERITHILDRTLLADALIALGREQDVISFAYSAGADRWLIDRVTTLNFLSALAEKGKLALGQKLFRAYTDEFLGPKSDTEDEVDDYGSQIIGTARCMGIYPEIIASPLHWLSQFAFTPGTLDPTDRYSPGYAPHLAAYIDALVQFGHTGELTRTHREGEAFPSNLVQYLLIRAYANHNIVDELRTAVTEYVDHECPLGNVELAYYAAKAGMPISEVSEMAGLIETPKLDRPDQLKLISDPVLINYAYSLVILSYEDSESTYRNLSQTVGTAPTLWNCALRHLLKACLCIGRSFRNDERDWYLEACESIDVLVNAERGHAERIAELIGNFRYVLQFTIGSLTEEIQKCFPERLDGWIEKLNSLRDSFLWNTHLGISESIEDYSFELSLWEILAKQPVVRARLGPILRKCASTFEDSTLLKGASRSNHFLQLAKIMATCGMHEDAEKWLIYGVRSSLIYGYRKDATLSILIGILRPLNQSQSEAALERCARVLAMVKWMPHLTDGRGTQHFTEEAFSAVLAVNRQAAFELLRCFSQTEARWKIENCMERYLLSAVEGDPEYLWCLSESFTNQHVTAKARERIVDIVSESHSEDIHKAFEDRFRQFVLTEVAPNQWPPDLKVEFSVPFQPDDTDHYESSAGDYGSKEFILDGENILGDDIALKCKESFSVFLTILEKLKIQNEHFFDFDLTKDMLLYHIAETRSVDDLALIKDYLANQERWLNSEIAGCLAKRFSEFGDQDSALEWFGNAYANRFDWLHWERSADYLAAIVETDKSIAKNRLLERCYDSASGPEGGFNTAHVAAAGYDVLDEPDMIEAVFNNFLRHCESLFAQMPQDDAYVWLKEYVEPDFDENLSILRFTMEELATQEVDLGKRLVRALTSLAIARPQSVIPPLIRGALEASGRILRRLMMILLSIAAKRPELLLSYQQTLAQFLEQEDFLCRQTAMHILHCVGEVSQLESPVAKAVQRVDTKFSGNHSYPTYRLSSSPSAEFSDFLKRRTLFDFSDQLSLMEYILQIRSGCLIAAIEERLSAQNWSMIEERFRFKSDWRGRVHPQGWPVVWVTTEFQEIAAEAVWSILNEAAEKMKLSRDQLRWLWQSSQGVDPEYVVDGIMSRPLDVEVLRVTDKDEWFKELDEIELIQIGENGNEKQRIEWITVFERRSLAQEDERSNVPFRQEIFQHAILVPLQVFGWPHELDKLEFLKESIVPFRGMPITLEQAREELTKKGRLTSRNSIDNFPLFAEHLNPNSFMGYMSVCTLSSSIIDDFGLSFEGLNLTNGDKTVAKYEAWEEGYQNEAYSRAKLSSGVRLRVRRDFLASVCLRYQRMICIRIEETRAYHKSIEKREPDAKRDSKRYVLFHL